MSNCIPNYQESIEQSGKHQIIVCQEKNRVFELTNANSHHFEKVKIDKGLISQKDPRKRCDFGIYFNQLNICYLIELKGSDFREAVSQINSTLDIFAQHLSSVDHVNARIVYKKSTPDIRDTASIKLKSRVEKQFKGTFLYSTIKMTESI